MATKTPDHPLTPEEQLVLASLPQVGESEVRDPFDTDPGVITPTKSESLMGYRTYLHEKLAAAGDGTIPQELQSMDAQAGYPVTPESERVEAAAQKDAQKASARGAPKK